MEQRDDRRAAAIDRITNQREFKNHTLVYCAVNPLLVVIWAASGAGYFWPIWSIGGWGIGLFFHWWNVYNDDEPITEDDIQREMDRQTR